MVIFIRWRGGGASCTCFGGNSTI